MESNEADTNSQWPITEGGVTRWPILTPAEKQAKDAEFRAYLVTLGQALASGQISEAGLPDVWDMANEEDYGENEEPLDEKDEDNE